MKTKVDIEREALDWTELDKRVSKLAKDTQRVKIDNMNLEADFEALKLRARKIANGTSN